MATTARSQFSDFFYNNRFGLQIENGPFGRQTIGGFQSITMPEQSIEQLEYSEGIYTYSRVYPGRSTFNTITLSKGVVRFDNDLGKWIRRAAEGYNYRANLVIYQFHRSDVEGKINYRVNDAFRKIKLFNCVPIRYKPGSDFDAMSSEISIQEIEFAMERFVISAGRSEV